MRCADFCVFSLRVQGPQPLPLTAQVILPFRRLNFSACTRRPLPCYSISMDGTHRAHPSSRQSSAIIARSSFERNINFDGTKRPMVVLLSLDPIIWYKSPLFRFIRSSK
jgi:hypothetical protein